MEPPMNADKSQERQSQKEIEKSERPGAGVAGRLVLGDEEDGYAMTCPTITER